MTLRHIISVVACALCLLAGARTPAEQRFITAPQDGTVFIIDSLTRLDMLDYYAAAHLGASRNLMGGDTRLVALDSMSMTLQASRTTRQQMWLMPTQRGDTLTLLITTHQLPVAVSALALYDSHWRPLTQPVQPTLQQWTGGDRRRRDAAARWLPFVAYEARYDPSTRRLTLTNTMDAYYTDPDDLSRLHSLLVPRLIYQWDGRVFKKL